MLPPTFIKVFSTLLRSTNKIADERRVSLRASFMIHNVTDVVCVRIDWNISDVSIYLQLLLATIHDIMSSTVSQLKFLPAYMKIQKGLSSKTYPNLGKPSQCLVRHTYILYQCKRQSHLGAALRTRTI